MNKILLFALTICVSAFTQAQIYQGTHTFGTGGFDLPQASAIDDQGNIYSAGNVSSSVTFGTDNLTYRGGNADGYLAKYDPMGNPIWIKSFASGFDDVVIDMTIPSSGDIFLTGYFQGAGTQSFDADPGPGVFTLSQPAPILSRDCFIIKLDSNGDFVWAKQVSNPQGGAAQEDSFAIEVGEQGDVYVGGRFIYADFDPGAGMQTILTPTQGFEGFLLKLDSNGDFVWVNHLKNSYAAVRDISLDLNGDIVVVGEFDGTIDVSGASAAAVNLTSAGGNDVFMVKYDPMGNHVWSQKIGGTAADAVTVIKSATNGEYFIGGSFNGTIDIDPDPNLTLNITSSGATDGYVLKLNANGRYNNHYLISGTAANDVLDLNLEYTGNLIVTGSFSSTVDFDNSSTGTASTTSLGATDAYVLALNPTALLYNAHFDYGGTGNSKMTQVLYDSSQDRLSFVGGFSNTVDFDPFSGIDNKSSTGLDDIYLMQLAGSVLSNNISSVDTSIALYPNPANSFINLSAANRLENATIIDINGRMLSQTNFTGNTTQQRISLENLSSGIYFVTIKSEVGQKVEKLVVE